jgi:hypothetical protein
VQEAQGYLGSALIDNYMPVPEMMEKKHFTPKANLPLARKQF